MTATMETARRRATRTRLVQAAIVEFGRHGIDATSVEQLCERAGFTRGAFYSNFATKDDLCIELACHVAQELAARLREAVATMPAEMDPEEMLTALLGVAEVNPDVRLAQLEMDLRAARHPEFAERLSAAREQWWPLYLEVAEMAADRAGVEFRIPLADVLRVLEAITNDPGRGEARADVNRLMAQVIQALQEFKA